MWGIEVGGGKETISGVLFKANGCLLDINYVRKERDIQNPPKMHFAGEVDFLGTFECTFPAVHGISTLLHNVFVLQLDDQLQKSQTQVFAPVSINMFWFNGTLYFNSPRHQPPSSLWHTLTPN